MTITKAKGKLLSEMAQNPFHFLDQRYGILYPVTLNYHNLKVFLKDNLKICCLLNVGAGFVK